MLYIFWVLLKNVCVANCNEWTKEADARKFNFRPQPAAFAFKMKILVAVQLQLIRTSGEEANEYKPLFEIF